MTLTRFGYKFLRTLLIMASLLVSLTVTSFCVLFFMLVRGPVDLSFLKSNLFSHFHIAPKTLDFEALEAELDLNHGQLSLTGKTITLQSLTPKIQKIYMDQCRFEWKLRTLLMLRHSFKSLHIQGLHIHIPTSPLSSAPGRIQYDFDQKKFFKHLDHLASVKGVTIKDATLTFLHNTGTVQQKLSMQANMTRIKDTLNGYMAFEDSSGDLKITVTVQQDNKMAPIGIKGTIEDLSALDIKNIASEIFMPYMNFEKANFKFSGTYDRKKKTIISHLIGQVHQISLSQDHPNARAMKIPLLDIKARGHNRQIFLEHMNFSIAGVPINVKAQGLIDDGQDHCHISLNARVQKFPVQDINAFWPQDIMPKARSWVIEHITKGTMSAGQISVESLLDFSGKNLFITAKNLEGIFELEDINLTYLATMPKIENLRATLNFNQNHMIFTIHEAQTSHLKLSNARVWIGPFNAQVQYLKLQTEVQGSLPSVIAFLDHKPLQYPKNYRIEVSKVQQYLQGSVKAGVSLEFPLSIPFESKKFIIAVDSHIENATIHKNAGLSFAGVDLEIEQGQFDVHARNDGLRMHGVALINGLNAAIDFDHPVKGYQQLMLKTQITDQVLGKIWDPSAAFVSGTIPVILIYNGGEKNTGFIDIQADLSEALLNLLVFEKEKHHKGHLSLKASLTDGVISSINELSLTCSGGWDVVGQFNQLRTRKEGEISVSHYKNKVLSTHIDWSIPNNTTITIEGQTLDLSPIRRLNFKKQFIKGTSSEVFVKMDAHKITFGAQKGLLNNQLMLTLSGGQVRDLHYHAMLEGSNHTNTVTCNITTSPTGIRKFLCHCLAGGDLLSLLNIMDNLKGGTLRIIASHDPKFLQDEWIGKLKFEKFSLLNAPFITRFFSLVFPTGIADLGRDGGIKFKLFKMRFGFSNQALKIHGARAFGHSLGFAFKGYINRGDKKDLALTGSMIPAYILNSMLANIPLIGQLLTGGQDQGLFAINFKVTGSLDHPEISTNPFSALTPGIIRKIFSSADGEGHYSDFWLDQNIIKDDFFDQEFLE